MFFSYIFLWFCRRQRARRCARRHTELYLGRVVLTAAALLVTTALGLAKDNQLSRNQLAWELGSVLSSLYKAVLIVSCGIRVETIPSQTRSPLSKKFAV